MGGGARGFDGTCIRATCISRGYAQSHTCYNFNNNNTVIYIIIIINFIIINTGTEIITSRSVYMPRCSLASYIAHTVYS